MYIPHICTADYQVRQGQVGKQDISLLWPNDGWDLFADRPCA